MSFLQDQYDFYKDDQNFDDFEKELEKQNSTINNEDIQEESDQNNCDQAFMEEDIQDSLNSEIKYQKEHNEKQSNLLGDDILDYNNEEFENEQNTQNSQVSAQQDNEIQQQALQANSFQEYIQNLKQNLEKQGNLKNKENNNNQSKKRPNKGKNLQQKNLENHKIEEKNIQNTETSEEIDYQTNKDKKFQKKIKIYKKNPAKLKKKANKIKENNKYNLNTLNLSEQEIQKKFFSFQYDSDFEIFFQNIKQNNISQALKQLQDVLEIERKTYKYDSQTQQLRLEFIIIKLNKLVNSMIKHKLFEQIKLILNFCDSQLKGMKTTHYNYINLKALIKNSVSILQKKQGDLEMPIKILHKIIKKQKKYNQTQYLQQSYLCLSEIQAIIQNYQSSCENAQIASDLYENKIIQYMQQKYQVLEKKEEIIINFIFSQLQLSKSLEKNLQLERSQNEFLKTKQLLQQHESSLSQQFFEKIQNIVDKKLKQITEDINQKKLIDKFNKLKQLENDILSSKQLRSNNNKTYQNISHNNFMENNKNGNIKFNQLQQRQKFKKQNEMFQSHKILPQEQKIIQPFAQAYSVKNSDFIRKGDKILLKQQKQLFVSKQNKRSPHPLLRNKIIIENGKNDNKDYLSHNTLSQFLSKKKLNLKQNISIRADDLSLSPKPKSAQNKIHQLNQNNASTSLINKYVKVQKNDESVKNNDNLQITTIPFSQNCSYNQNLNQQNNLNKNNNFVNISITSIASKPVSSRFTLSPTSKYFKSAQKQKKQKPQLYQKNFGDKNMEQTISSIQNNNYTIHQYNNNNNPNNNNSTTLLFNQQNNTQSENNQKLKYPNLYQSNNSSNSLINNQRISNKPQNNLMRPSSAQPYIQQSNHNFQKRNSFFNNQKITQEENNQIKEEDHDSFNNYNQNREENQKNKNNNFKCNNNILNDENFSQNEQKQIEDFKVAQEEDDIIEEDFIQELDQELRDNFNEDLEDDIQEEVFEDENNNKYKKKQFTNNENQDINDIMEQISNQSDIKSIISNSITTQKKQSSTKEIDQNLDEKNSQSQVQKQSENQIQITKNDAIQRELEEMKLYQRKIQEQEKLRKEKDERKNKKLQEKTKYKQKQLQESQKIEKNILFELDHSQNLLNHLLKQQDNQKQLKPQKWTEKFQSARNLIKVQKNTKKIGQPYIQEIASQMEPKFIEKLELIKQHQNLEYHIYQEQLRIQYLNEDLKLTQLKIQELEKSIENEQNKIEIEFESDQEEKERKIQEFKQNQNKSYNYQNNLLSLNQDNKDKFDENNFNQLQQENEQLVKNLYLKNNQLVTLYDSGTKKYALARHQKISQKHKDNYNY